MILTDETIARDRLERMCDANADPVLDSGVITDILTETQIADVWAASTAYEFGASVIPTANKRNGHRYRIVAFDGTGRTSGTTEPAWPIDRDSQITDGKITWQEDGPERDLWDLQRAACMGWKEKAALVAAQYDFATDGQSFHESQKYKHCMAMANAYAPVNIG